MRLSLPLKVIAFIVISLFILFPNTALAAKRIGVDLSSQRLYAYDDNTLIYNFTISSGKPWWPTPTGNFKPWTKITSHTMRGGSTRDGTYYNLPNVPYSMYFYQGYAIHGAYWHNNFGRPMSHGCVNLRPSDAALLYNWTGMDTPISIYGATPK